MINRSRATLLTALILSILSLPAANADEFADSLDTGGDTDAGYVETGGGSDVGGDGVAELSEPAPDTELEGGEGVPPVVPAPDDSTADGHWVSRSNTNSVFGAKADIYCDSEDQHCTAEYSNIFGKISEEQYAKAWARGYGYKGAELAEGVDIALAGIKLWTERPSIDIFEQIPTIVSDFSASTANLSPLERAEADLQAAEDRVDAISDRGSKEFQVARKQLFAAQDAVFVERKKSNSEGEGTTQAVSIAPVELAAAVKEEVSLRVNHGSARHPDWADAKGTVEAVDPTICAGSTTGSVSSGCVKVTVLESGKAFQASYSDVATRYEYMTGDDLARGGYGDVLINRSSEGSSLPPAASTRPSVKDGSSLVTSKDPVERVYTDADIKTPMPPLGPYEVASYDFKTNRWTVSESKALREQAEAWEYRKGSVAEQVEFSQNQLQQDAELLRLLTEDPYASSLELAIAQDNYAASVGFAEQVAYEAELVETRSGYVPTWLRY